MPTDKKISELAEAPVGTLADSDLFVVVDVSAGTTKKALGSTLKQFIGAHAPTGLTTLDGDLIVHDDVKWLWLTNTEGIPGTARSEVYDSGVLSPVEFFVPNIVPVVGAIPTAIENAPGVVPSIIPVGSAANVAVGVQVGDRLFWADNYNWGHQGIYVVTDLGSVATPWILTRAADQPEADILLAFYVEVEDTDIVIRTTVAETTPDWIYPAVSTAPNAIAIGPGALASGIDAFAFGGSSTASGTKAVAIGFASMATATDSTAIGKGATVNRENTVVIDGAVFSQQTGLVFPAAGSFVLDATDGMFFDGTFLNTDTELTTANLKRGSTLQVFLRCDPGASADYDLTFPAAWTFVGSARPAVLLADTTAILTVYSLGTTDDYCIATYQVSV